MESTSHARGGEHGKTLFLTTKAATKGAMGSTDDATHSPRGLKEAGSKWSWGLQIDVLVPV